MFRPSANCLVNLVRSSTAKAQHHQPHPRLLFFSTDVVSQPKIDELQTSSLPVADNRNLHKTEIVTPAVASSPLTDTFGRHHTYLRISLTERCNLRCKYCMPADGIDLTPKQQLLTNAEIVYLSQLFVEQGIRKIRLTGGEPTVRKDIVEIVKNLKSIKDLESVTITTNGLMLLRLLVPMQRAGLDGLNISLDTLKTGRYGEITRRKGWERVMAGIDLAIQLGYRPKINCVVMKANNTTPIVSSKMPPISSAVSALVASSSNLLSTNSSSRSTFRSHSTFLTHIDADGRAKMVDVDHKKSTKRFAQAKAIVYVGPQIAKLIRNDKVEKGDVITVSQLAGILAAKKTSELIPLCHNIPLSAVHVQVELDFDASEVVIVSEAKCEGKTGVELEALVGATVAALTIYDMCKAVSHDIVIKDVRLMEKSGGKLFFKRQVKDGDETGITLKYNTEPIKENEPFYPIHI